MVPGEISDLYNKGGKTIFLADQDLENSLMARVSHTLHRLETFGFIQNASDAGTDVQKRRSSESHQLDSINAWIEFSRAEMFLECCRRLGGGQLKAAMLIWKRHQVVELNVL